MLKAFREFLAPMWLENIRRGRPKFMLEPKEYMSGMCDYINKIAQSGYRFNGIVLDDRYIEQGALLMFEPTTQKFKYSYRWMEEFRETIREMKRKNPSFDPTEDFVVTNIYEPLGNIHACVFIANMSSLPILFIAEEVKENEGNTGKTTTEKLGGPKGSKPQSNRVADKQTSSD